MSKSSLPPLPSAGQDPWFAQRNAWDQAVDQELQYLRGEISYLENVTQDLYGDIHGYSIIAAGRPDIPATLASDIATRVNYAPSGTVFRSTDGPQGAWEWRKQGSTWAVTQGDTRYRNASDSLLSGWTGRIDITRIGRMVDVFLYDLTAGAGAADDFINIPTGYRPRYRTNPYESWVVSNRSLSDTPTVRRVGAYGSTLRMYGKDASDGMTGHLTFFTDDGWPTTLPGV